MPFFESSFDEAIKAFSANEYHGWGIYRKTDFSDPKGKFAGQRLRANALFTPGVLPSASLTHDDTFFAMGSCFAREIEKALVDKGVRFLSATKAFNDEPKNLNSGSGAHAATYITKYHAFSIMNAFRWAFEDPKPYADENFVEVSSGLFADLHSHITLAAVPLEEARLRRKKVDDYVRQVAEADVVILTLGICELWWDRETETYLNTPPGGLVGRRFPDRFVFRIPDYSEICAALDETWRVLNKHCKPGVKIVCTVSPIALNDTFRRDEDVVVANCYTKSLNRVAVEYWRSKYDNVYYFPSYEMSINSDPAVAWLDDRRHPSDKLVDNIVDTFEAFFMK